jgi:hypothetical protein
MIEEDAASKCYVPKSDALVNVELRQRVGARQVPGRLRKSLSDLGDLLTCGFRATVGFSGDGYGSPFPIEALSDKTLLKGVRKLLSGWRAGVVK